jgi:hypothetical protein
MAEEPHERSTVSVRDVLIGAAAIGASVLIALVAARGLMAGFGELPPVVAGKPFARSAGPPLEVNPQEDLKRFREDENRKLEQYRLVDEQSGAVQIPIERAMALLAREHGADATEGAGQ